MGKLKLATVWFSGCSGCHMSFLDLDHRLEELAGVAELVYSPLVDRKEFPEGVDITLVEGAVGNREQLELLREIRKKTRILVAFGDCAVTGNVPSLRNVLPREMLLEEVYGVNDPPGLKDGEVPELLPQASPLGRFVPVDHYIPGCPPSPERIWKFLEALLKGREPTLSGKDIRFG